MIGNNQQLILAFSLFSNTYLVEACRQSVIAKELSADPNGRRLIDLMLEFRAIYTLIIESNDEGERQTREVAVSSEWLGRTQTFDMCQQELHRRLITQEQRLKLNSFNCMANPALGGFESWEDVTQNRPSRWMIFSVELVVDSRKFIEVMKDLFAWSDKERHKGPPLFFSVNVRFTRESVGTLAMQRWPSSAHLEFYSFPDLCDYRAIGGDDFGESLSAHDNLLLPKLIQLAEQYNGWWH